MAFDYFSIPATSTAVERVFSQGRHLLHFTRNRLSPASIQAIMCLGHWSRKDLIGCADVVSAIKGRRRQEEDDEGLQEDEE
ncbi:hypothetical protein H0H92_010196 [Tricholoma furcatifolium]|nr:hypothetical protein H0H92_012357 [Tricholoma furcatifolium]KAG6806737.1 hypothetical protein H0H92_010196 [Tricholoma furcatifolium]